MIRFLIGLISFCLVSACSNTADFETGEIKTLKIIKEAIDAANQPKTFVKARKLLSREQVDSANTRTATRGNG